MIGAIRASEYGNHVSDQCEKNVRQFATCERHDPCFGWFTCHCVPHILQDNQNIVNWVAGTLKQPQEQSNHVTARPFFFLGKPLSIPSIPWFKTMFS